MKTVDDYQKKWIIDRLLIRFFLLSLLILILSFYHQYDSKIKPCLLCQWQRHIYFLVFFLSPFGLIRCCNSSVRHALSLIFFSGLCLSIYHSLVQFEWITDRCTMEQKIENLNDFMKMLDQPKTSCANISWKFLGLSASVYNIFFSIFALISLNFKNIKRLIHV